MSGECVGWACFLVGIVPSTMAAVWDAGRACRLDRDAKARGFDRYEQPRFAQLECGKELPDGVFDLITAVEVFEHLLDPIDVCFAASTPCTEGASCSFPPSFINAAASRILPVGLTWRSTMGSTSLFTRQGLRRTARAAGLRHVYTVKGGPTPFLHLFIHEKGRALAGARLSGLAAHVG
jgi:hypothetical protein